MDETLQSLLGGGLPRGLLSQVEEAQAEQRARNAGLLNLAFGALQASRGAPGQRAPSLGQIIGQAGPVGVQAYQQSFDQTLQNALRGMQIQEMRRKQEEQEEVRQRTRRFEQSLQGAFAMTPSVRGVLETQTNIDPALLEQMSAQEVIATAPKTEKTLDQGKFMQALAEFSPLEYAKLAFKQSEEPGQIQTLRALIKDPALMEAFLKVEGARRPLTSVEVKNEAQRLQGLFKEVDLPIVQGFTTSAQSAREFAQTSNTINNLLKGKGGGALVQIGTDVARTLGVNPGQVSAADLAQSLVTQAAPRMRPPGSGSTSDLEFKSYMASIPSLASSEQGRDLMAKYSTAFAERSAKLADYARALAREDKLSFEAIQKYDESLGPVLKEDFYKFAPTGVGAPVDFRTGRPRGGS
jgi:hypothetical protein